MLNAELNFLRRVFAGYTPALAIATVLMASESIIVLTQPWFAAKAARGLLAGTVSDLLLLQWIASLLLLTILAIASARVLGRTASRLMADVGSQVYDHLQALPLGWHHERKRGEVLALMTNDVVQLSSFLTGILVPLLPLLLTCAGALLLLARIDFRIGLLIGFGVPVFLLLLKLSTRQLRPLAEASLQEDAVKQGIAEQNLATLPIIKAFTREATESRRYAIQSDKVFALEMQRMRIESLLGPSVRLLMAIGVLGLLWLGMHGVEKGSFSPADLVGLLLYGMLLSNPVSELANVYGRIQSAQGSARRLMALLGESVEKDTGKTELAQVRGDVRFEGVRFGYRNRPMLFESLDLHLRAGETVAITGANGVGKSTIAYLLMRFMEANGGLITLDGIDIRQLPLRDLRSHVGLVSQQVLLLNDTVANNIGYGRTGASPVDIHAAARAAHADRFINQLPDGYETVIGDEGVRLSGGQRQRISLARALLRNSAVLILDEATAMFDPDGERGFIAECHDLLHARTVLLITHRPASLALADRVLLLENGTLRQAETAQSGAEAPLSTS